MSLPCPGLMFCSGYREPPQLPPSSGAEAELNQSAEFCVSSPLPEIPSPASSLAPGHGEPPPVSPPQHRGSAASRASCQNPRSRCLLPRSRARGAAVPRAPAGRLAGPVSAASRPQQGHSGPARRPPPHRIPPQPPRPRRRRETGHLRRRREKGDGRRIGRWGDLEMQRPRLAWKVEDKKREMKDRRDKETKDK